MPFPTQRQIEIPLLRLVKDSGGEAKPRDVYERLARQFPELTPGDLAERMESGQPKWENLVRWVRQNLVGSGDLDGSTRDVWRITKDGRARLRDASTLAAGNEDREAPTTVAVPQGEGAPMFTWIPIHREAVQRMLALPNAQSELLSILHEMEASGLTVISLQDRSADGETFPLSQIDPLTFLSSFNRGITETKRRDNWHFLKKKWSLDTSVPEDFAGIPIVNNMSSWFFPYARRRANNHVERLWELIRQAAVGPLAEVDESLFEECRQLRKVTIHNLSMGLFWINPSDYLPCDKKTRAYGAHHGVSTTPADYTSYGIWLDEMSRILGRDYPRISHDAHLWSSGDADDGDDANDGVQGEVAETPTRVWVVAPGKKARKWDDFYERGVIAIDYADSLGDLTQYVDEEEIRRKLQEHEETDSSKVNDTRSCWDFSRIMQPGDIIFAKRGIDEVVGYGLVEGEYTFDTSLEAFRHIRKVDWQAKGEWDLPESARLPLKTLTEITKNRDLVDTLSQIVGRTSGGPRRSRPQEETVRTNGPSYWWLNANPQVWSFEGLAIGHRQTYTSHNENGNKRQKYKYFRVFSRICGSPPAPVADPAYGTGRFPGSDRSENRTPFWRSVSLCC